MSLESFPQIRFPKFSDTWCVNRLIDLSKGGFSNGVFNDTEKKGSGYKLINVKDMYVGNSISVADLTLLNIDEKEFKKNKVLKGDIFFTRSSIVAEGIAYSNIYLDDNEDVTYDGHLMKMTPDSSKILPQFLFYVLKTFSSRKQFIRRGKISTMTTIGQDDIAPVKLLIPTLEEQQKVADFLSSVDKKINLLKEKHTLLIQYKKGVMQKLFKQEIRFKDDNGKAFPDWQEEKLGNHLEEYKEKSKEENQFEVLTSSRTGLMKQSDYYGEGRITERSNKGFNVIPNGYLTYRSRSDDRQFFFNLNELGFTGIISTYYPVFKMKNNQNKFFVELSRFHKNRFGRQAVGTSQVVLSFNEVKSIKFSMPSTEEQSKISAFLNAIDKKLEAVNEQIELTQSFKKGLLQQMFV